MTYTKEEQAANRAKWTAALRSGEYEQGQTYLRKGDKFCCLGVACDVAIKNGLDLGATPIDNDFGPSYWAYGSSGIESILPDEVQEWLGLSDTSGTLKEASASEFNGNLWKLNDRAAFSFEQIADVIDSGKVEVQ